MSERREMRVFQKCHFSVIVFQSEIVAVLPVVGVVVQHFCCLTWNYYCLTRSCYISQCKNLNLTNIEFSFLKILEWPLVTESTRCTSKTSAMSSSRKPKRITGFPSSTGTCRRRIESGWTRLWPVTIKIFWGNDFKE